MIKVLVFSDIRLYCEGLCEMLEREGTLSIVGSIACLQELQSLDNTIAPDIVLLDISSPLALQVLEQASSQFSDARIVAVAVREHDINIIECVRAGVVCYVPRDAAMRDLLEAVVGAAKGKVYCPPNITASLFNKIAENTSVSLPNSSGNFTQRNRLEPLTQREKEIASMMANGLSNKYIAVQLSIEVSTVKNHVHNILVKIGARNRTQAASILLGQFSGRHAILSIG